jgi:hypothetical protein
MEGWKWVARTAALSFVLLAGLAFPAQATTLSGEAVEAPQGEAKKQVVKEYLQSCRGGKKNDKECAGVREQAVAVLKDDLLTLGSSADRGRLPLLAKVLRSDEAELRAAAADAMGMIGPGREEVPALLKALNDPVPQVRYSVRTALQGKADPDPAADLLLRRANKDRGKDLIPDSPPKEDRLGIPLYQEATFLYYASNIPGGKAAFATPDPPETILKFYAARAKQSPMTLEQFSKAYKGKPDQAAQRQMGMAMMDRMMKAMQEGKNPQELQAEMMRGMTTDLPTREYNDKELFESPVFLVLEESDLGGWKSPTRFVVVFADRALNQTGFVLHVPVEVPSMKEPSAPRQPRRRPQ